MRKIKILAVAMLFSFFLVPGAYAQNLGEDLPEAGLAPDSPFYFLDIWGENIGTLFTFGDEARVERFARLAGERLAEARDVIKRERSERAREAIEKYEGHLVRIEEKIGNLGQSEAVQDRVADATATHQAVLEVVHEQVPEEAKSAIAEAIKRSMRGHEEAVRRLSELNDRRAGEVAARAVQKRLEAMRELAQRGVVSDEAAERFDNNFDRYEEFTEEFENTRDGFRARFRARLGDSLRVAYEFEDEESFEEASGQDVPSGAFGRFQEEAREFRQKYKERFRELARENPEDAAEAYEKILNQISGTIEEARERREAMRRAALDDMEEFRQTSQNLAEEIRERSGSEEGEGTNSEEIINRIEEAHASHIERLRAVSEELPEKAREEVERAVNLQEENREQMLNRLRDALQRQDAFREEATDRGEELRDRARQEREEVRRDFEERADEEEQPSSDSGAQEPAASEPQSATFAIEADDNGFYINNADIASITVRAGSVVAITLNVKSTDVYFGGLDFRGCGVSSGGTSPGSSTTVEFKAADNCTITSYWPASNQVKDRLGVIVE